MDPLGSYDRAKLLELSDWFTQITALPTKTPAQAQILDEFARAGITTAQQIEQGVPLGRLLEQTALKIDDFVAMAQRCPALGKASLKAEG
jgi:hypothetical protein